MRRAIVHDPKDTSGLVIGGLRHDLSNKAVKGRDSTALFTAAKHFGSVDIECRQIGPCTTALILMFHLHRRAGLGRLRGIDAGSGLDAGLFIGGQNKFIVLEQLLFQTLSYRSRIRLAFVAKCGSRGKIQQRCCQGRMASWFSQRHTVLSLMVATKPDRRTSPATSAVLHRERGRACFLGDSQTKALT